MWDILVLRLLVLCRHHERKQVSGACQSRDHSPLSCRTGLEDVQYRERAAFEEGDPCRRFVLRYRRPDNPVFTEAVLDDVLASATAQFLENEYEPQLQANHRVFAMQISGLYELTRS